MTEPLLSLFSLRYVPAGVADLDGLNLRLVEAINMDGRIYVTQTRVDGEIVLRFQAGQFECTERDVAAARDGSGKRPRPIRPSTDPTPTSCSVGRGVPAVAKSDHHVERAI